MNWDLILSRSAERAFRSLSAKERERINRALNELKSDPFSGDVIPLKGELSGRFRRRVGP